MSRRSDLTSTYKVTLVGDSRVGKSNLLLRYTKGEFSPNTLSTVGVDFSLKKVAYQDEVINVQIWDTAGQERYKAITNTYYRGSACVLIVYDITNRISFEHVFHWLEEFQEHGDQDSVFVLVGNKCDLAKNREVSVEEGIQFAKQHGCSFFETSALDATGVDELFQCVITEMHKIYTTRKANEPTRNGETVKVHIEPSHSRRSDSGCCDGGGGDGSRARSGLNKPLLNSNRSDGVDNDGLKLTPADLVNIQKSLNFALAMEEEEGNEPATTSANELPTRVATKRGGASDDAEFPLQEPKREGGSLAGIASAIQKLTTIKLQEYRQDIKSDFDANHRQLLQQYEYLVSLLQQQAASQSQQSPGNHEAATAASSTQTSDSLKDIVHQMQQLIHNFQAQQQKQQQSLQFDYLQLLEQYQKLTGLLQDRTDLIILENQNVTAELEALKQHNEAIIRRLDKQDCLLTTLVDDLHRVPSLVVLLPVIATTTSKQDWITHPIKFFRDTYRICFVCSYTFQITLCGPSDAKNGYLITRPKEWVKRAAPLLQTGLALVKLGLSITGLPLPVPDLVGMVKSLDNKFLDSAMQLVEDISVSKTKQYYSAVTTDTDETKFVGLKNEHSLQEVPDYDPKVYISKLEKCSVAERRTAHESIREFLKEVDPHLQHTGLRKAINANGETKWIWDHDEVYLQFLTSSMAGICSEEATQAIIKARHLHEARVKLKEQEAQLHAKTCSSYFCFGSK